MTFLFCGLSGIGKSELAKYIAKRCRKKIEYKSYSALVSPWIGETESYIADTFADAEKNKRILLIDECDSLFRSRTYAIRSWEISQINELFTQIDMYRGILICTTNFISKIDPAAARRFTFKVEFYELEKSQRLEIFNLYFAEILGFKIYRCQTSLVERLNDLDGLSAGDLRTVWNKIRFAPDEYKTAEHILEFLQFEVYMKKNWETFGENKMQLQANKTISSRNDFDSQIELNL